MQIHLARNGQVLGQHEAGAIPALLQSGTVLPTDFYWHDGMAEWATVQTKWPAASATVASASDQPIHASPTSAPPFLPAMSSVERPAASPVGLSAATTTTAGAPASTLTSAPAAFDREAIAQANPTVISGARWFWWIAGLSAVNSILSHTGSEFGFVIGLGFTLFADALFKGAKIVAFLIDALAIGFFFGAGWFAGKGRLWAFVVGIAAYVCDLLLCLLAQDWMLIAFHAFALFCLVRGALALRADLREARQAAPTA